MPSVANAPFDAYRGPLPFIFVSYSHRDGDLVFPEIKRLSQLGYRIWYDEGIDPGNEWPEEIAKALKEAAYFIVFISEHATRSSNVKSEIGFALKYQKPFLAIHLSEVELPPGLELRMAEIQAVFRWQLPDESYHRKIQRALPEETKGQIQEPTPVLKHILTCDGGGIRAVFALQIIQRIERLLRDHHGNPNLVLSDHYDFFAGTSTGAIIATCLCRGMSSDEILEFYLSGAAKLFSAAVLEERFLLSRYESLPLTQHLKEVFVDDDGSLSLLGSKKLRKLLLIVVQNAATGGPWPLTNNPQSKWNDLSRPESNLLIPLWQLIRACMAPPSSFPPEKITVGTQEYVFVDGAVSTYNNPSVLALQTATLPSYQVGWPAGADKIRLISIGALRFASVAALKSAEQLGWFYDAGNLARVMMDTSTVQQDMTCRTMGKCLFGAPIDSQVGDLIGDDGSPKRLSYVRYDKSYTARAMIDLESKYGTKDTPFDTVHSVPALTEIGREYAQEQVKLEHLV